MPEVRPPAETPPDPERRLLLRAGAGALAAAAGIGVAASLGFLWPPGRQRAGETIVVGMPGDLPPDGIVVLPRDHVAVGRTEDGFFALSLICPHLGCVLRWLDDVQRLHCPCHGSQFETDGTVLNGPARRDLRRLEVGLDDRGRLVVERPS